MQEFFKSYFNKLDLTTVFENLLTKSDFSFNFICAILHS